MSRRLLLLALSLLLSCQAPPSPTPRATPTPEATARKTLVALGDSLTEGLGVEPEQAYPAQLERRLQAEGLPWKVVNAGYSGETSSGARSRLDWVLKLKPDAVLLETGGNDSLRGIPPEVTEENLVFLVQELQKKRIPVMLAGMKTLTNMGPDYTSAFEKVYPTVAERCGIPLIPFFLEGVGGVPKLNQEDKIHPTEQGYTRIVDHIAPTVLSWLKSLESSEHTRPETRSTP